MVLSRFWYVVLGVSLAMTIFLLYLATAVSNRTANGTSVRLLNATSNAVEFYLQDDARTRAAALIPLALDPAVQKGLSKASKADKLSELKSSMRENTRSALKRFREAEKKKPAGLVFDVLWAIDVHGRVVANDNYDKGTSSEYFEMGGYAIVADALHGWVRDDAWVLDGQIYKVVARPVETVVQGRPVGAIVAAKIVDDAYAQRISNRTGAALAFYAGNTRIATGAPASFDKAQLEVHEEDILALAEDTDYQEKGRTKARVIRQNAGFDVSAVFARLPGDAWSLGAGYVVGHRQATVIDPFEFERLANEDDKASVPIPLVIGVAALAILLGLVFSLLEHTVPLKTFLKATADLADKDSATDVLKPATFRGSYKNIAAYINDGLDKVAAASGVERGPADLQSVLGPLPTQPQMSAFAVPKGSARTSSKRPELPGQSSRKRSLPQSSRNKTDNETSSREEQPAASSEPTPGSGPGSSPAQHAQPASENLNASVDLDATNELPPDGKAPASGAHDPPRAAHLDAAIGAPPAQMVEPPARKALHAPGAVKGERFVVDDAAASKGIGEEKQWRSVYADFIALKKKLGEPTDRLSFDKFKGTLQRNKEALMARHGCERVKFRVYEKQGRAALKASPVK